MPAKQDFLNQGGPENYVAGLGRGATGFVTRSDLGPTKDGPSEDQIKDALAKRAAQIGQSVPTAYGVSESKADVDDERFGDLDNDVGLFAGGIYGPEDEEADRIWAEIDEKMARRRRNPVKEAARLEREEELKRKNPSISDQFADLRRGLESMTEEQWENLPDVPDFTSKIKRARKERMATRKFYSVPDTVLSGAKDYSAMETSIGVKDNPDEDDSAAQNGKHVDFNAIGAARSRALGAVMDQLEEMTGTNKSRTSELLQQLEAAERELPGQQSLGDIERARELFKSITKSNPKHAAGWISFARLEEHAGNLEEARELIKKGAEQCLQDPDIWKEAVRLWRDGNNENSKKLVYDGVRYNPKSYELWMLAAELEDDVSTKKAIVNQGLDNIPVSETLWKLLVNLEDDPEQAKSVLGKAVEYLPHSIDLWLALVRLEEVTGDAKKAQAVINKARKNLPTSHEIWMAALTLCVRSGQGQQAQQIVERCVSYLKDKAAMLPRAEWIAEAEKLEQQGYPTLPKLIIDATFEYELTEDDVRLDIWKEDADRTMKNGCIETAKAMYDYVLRTFENLPAAWSLAIEFFRRHGSNDELLDHLERATMSCPDSDDFWIQRTKELFRAGKLEEASAVISAALSAKESEKRLLATIDLEINAGMKDEASQHFAFAKTSLATDRLYMKYAVLERSRGDLDSAQGIAAEALKLWPHSPKLHMIKGQILETKSDLRAARDAYNVGTQTCPHSIPLWLLATRLEARTNGLTKARTILDRARLANPKNQELWLEAVRMERLNYKNDKRKQSALTLMSRALSECPKSGVLVAERILYLEDRTRRKTAALQAMRTLDENDKHVFIAIARIFWGQRALEKAVTWFEKAIKVDPDYADGWVWFNAFLQKHGSEEKKHELVNQFALEEPRHGEIWQKVAKAPENLGKSAEELLRLTVDEVHDAKWRVENAP